LNFKAPIVIPIECQGRYLQSVLSSKAVLQVAAAGLQPNAELFGVLLDALVRAGKLEEARAMFSSMQVRFFPLPVCVCVYERES
jgi:pentatricopeptide repeat protein